MRRSVVSVEKLGVISRMSGFVEVRDKERKEVVVRGAVASETVSTGFYR